MLPKRVGKEMHRAILRWSGRDVSRHDKARKIVQRQDPGAILLRENFRKHASESVEAMSPARELVEERKKLTDKIEGITNALSSMRGGTDVYRERLSELQRSVQKKNNINRQIRELTQPFFHLTYEYSARMEAAHLALDWMGFGFQKPAHQVIRESIITQAPHLFAQDPFQSTHKIDKRVVAASRLQSIKRLIPILGPLGARRFYRRFQKFYSVLAQ
ncbi:MAG: hypothetical protein U1C71_04310 [archaeon]|nr:hypothetical protein [archaeon]